MSYILSCCSTADLSKEHFESIHVNYVCFHYSLDGVEYPESALRVKSKNSSICS